MNDPGNGSLSSDIRGPATPEQAMRSARRHTRRQATGLPSKRSQRLMLLAALAVALLLLLAVSVYSERRIHALQIDNQQLQEQLFKSKQALAQVTPEMLQARKELGNLIKGQFPHLNALVPDKVIPVDSAYAKNIVFTILKRNGQTFYEYRLVMENNTPNMVRPDARIFVFDHRGAQIGMGEVSERADMVPGESRSYSSAIERFIDVEPRYFYVWTRGKKVVDTAK